MTREITPEDAREPRLLDDDEYRRGIEEYVRDLASKNPYCPNCVRVADEIRKRLNAAARARSKAL